ncbi:hypothetical protein Tco_0906130 [Tanacetum coccineum]
MPWCFLLQLASSRIIILLWVVFESEKQVAGESSSPKPSLNIRIKQQKSTSTTPLPPSDDEERDDIIEVTQLSLALDKTAKVYEEQRNMAAVEQNTLEEDVEKIVEGEEEYDGTEFADMVLLSDEDSGGMLEPESHKENPEKNDDDEKKDDKKDDDDDHDDHALIRTRVTGSLEIRTEKTQTPISSPPRSPMTDLSSDKEIAQELMVYVAPIPTTSSQDHSKPTSSRRTNLLGSISKISRRIGQLRQHMNNTFVTNRVFQEKIEEMCETLYNKVPELNVELFEGWKPLSPLQLAVEEMMSE